MTAFYYGLEGIGHLNKIANKVCDALGYGSNQSAHLLIMETAAAETHCGKYDDRTPNGAGYGLTQFDLIGFNDVKARTRAKDARTIYNIFGFAINEVEIEDLNHDATLALIFTRLKYKLLPEAIPADLTSRAVYWKRHYNTSAGKGTPEHYCESVETHLSELYGEAA